jgi:hypothetical protein
MPNITYATLEEIPEGLKEHATQKDGKFVVEVVPGVKLTEFRDNNVALSKQRDDLAAALAKLKPAVGESIEEFLIRHAELVAMQQKVKDGALKTSDAIETEVTNRVGAMKTNYDTQLAEANAQRAAAEKAKAESDNRFNLAIIQRAVTDAVVDDKSGANPSALPDILARAERVFKVINGVLIAKDGEATIYGSDGATPMTPKEWMVKLRAQAPYLFKGSSGGGADGGNRGGGARGTGYGGGNLTKAEFDALSPPQKMAYYHENNTKARKTT